MYDIIFVKHNGLTDELLDEIIAIKSVAWTYSYEAQRAWINNNIKDSDIHVILSLKKRPIAYLNLVQIEMQLDSKTYEGLGIGNVCAIEKGKGWGKVLLSFVNDYILEQNMIGLLFCKNELIRFYSDNGWVLIPNQKFIHTEMNSSVNTFIFNVPNEFVQVKYLGKPF